MREFFLANTAYWIREFHFDGLRLDATQQIFDSSEEHILAAITRTVSSVAEGRSTYVVGENEPQHAQLVRAREKGGYGLDALWNDDFHHSAIVALTGRNEAYYSDYRGVAQEFISAAKWGYLYQGQRYVWQKARRGSSCLDLHPWHFVHFVENHDQVANSLWGRRLFDLGNAGRARALTALLLLGPGTPMLFQGQEFAASSPFLYFADHNPELAKLVAAGRAEFLRQFPSINSPEAAALLPNPESEETFLRCKLDFADRERRRDIYQMHRDLLALRKIVRLAIESRGRKQAHTIIAPAVASGKICHRHHLQSRDAQGRKFRQLPGCRAPGAFAGEGANVHFINHAIPVAATPPLRVRPGKMPGIDDLRGAMRTFRLKARSGIGKEAVIQLKLVMPPRCSFARFPAEVAVALSGQCQRAALAGKFAVFRQPNTYAFRARCPNSKMRSRIRDLCADGKLPFQFKRSHSALRLHGVSASTKQSNPRVRIYSPQTPNGDSGLAGRSPCWGKQFHTIGESFSYH
ncbi:MAG: alpha-amylase family glycosyl hydrolase [Chthoniobacter sp.]|nr:alpha-amylase family glycosyl hydrolase [Chthoniobacter sp.]